jgi:zinc/manganese transport system substrate-binding protein
MRAALVAALIFGTAAAAGAAPLRVASLHPIASDLVRQVGGELVTVIDLMPLDSNPHTFYPSPAQLKQAADADLVLAMGKGLETYLDDLRESLGGAVPVFELGRPVPSLRVEASEVFLCCPAHATGAIDPHWWHSVRNTRRAALELADELIALRPEHAVAIRARADAYAEGLDGLYRWAKNEIARIPRADRELTTAHAAFGYLCREFGLRSITVLGLTFEQDPEPSYLKDVVRTLREHEVKAVFPELNANPKVLEGIAREAGVAIGGHLHADMVGSDDPTYEAMVRYNIMVLTEALAEGR